MGRDELEQLFRGYGYEPRFVEGDDAKALHPLLARTLDQALDRIAEIQHDARRSGFRARPAFPMIVSDVLMACAGDAIDRVESLGPMAASAS